MAATLLQRLAELPFVTPAEPTGVPAAVLLALAPVPEGSGGHPGRVPRRIGSGVGDDLDIVLVRRPDHMRQHAGQVALPGGAVDPGDRDHVAAALREAEEGVGLDRREVRVLGSLSRAYLHVSNFDVVPVVGVWDGRAPLRPNPSEVASILRPTLRQLADPANHGTLAYDRILPPAARSGRRLPADAWSPVFNLDGVIVWGFTAGLLSGFLDALGLTAPPLPAWWGIGGTPSRGSS
jgi:8-oxo-dGTP pyrophosphatase MutT (NUDIX family)